MSVLRVPLGSLALGDGHGNGSQTECIAAECTSHTDRSALNAFGLNKKSYLL